MAARRIVLAVAAVLVLGGCGSGDDVPAAAAAETPIAVATPTVTGKPATGKAGTGKHAAPAVATVAPEVVVPTTSDATSARTNLDGWQGRLVAALHELDPRLVTSDAAVLKKVRATCKQMETGMFETKVVPIIQKRFSNSEVTVTYDVGQAIYSLLLQDACYLITGS